MVITARNERYRVSVPFEPVRAAFAKLGMDVSDADPNDATFRARMVRWTASVHEAAHAVIARAVNLPVAWVEIHQQTYDGVMVDGLTMLGDGSGQDIVANPGPTLVQCLAGEEAERQFGIYLLPEVKDRDDFAYILAQVPTVARSQTVTKAQEMTQMLVAKYRDLILAVGAELRMRTRLTGAEVDDICEIVHRARMALPPNLA